MKAHDAYLSSKKWYEDNNITDKMLKKIYKKISKEAKKGNPYCYCIFRNTKKARVSRPYVTEQLNSLGYKVENAFSVFGLFVAYRIRWSS